MTPRNLTEWLVRRSTAVLIAVGAVTALLAVPFLTMEPDTSASQEPTGEVFDARDAIEEQLASSVFTTFMIGEDRGGDLLRVEPLQALLAAEQGLREDPEIGQTLFTYFDSDDEVTVVGIRTIADLVDERLPGGLAAASDHEVKVLATALLAERGGQQLGLSAETFIDEATGLAVSPATLFPVLSDDNMLGFGSGGVRIGGDTDSEEYRRSILAILRGDESVYQAWGVAIDVNLTAAEQGEAAGPFIGFTILVVLVIVGITFRSYWVLAVTGAALAALIVWLKGISNLIGLEERFGALVDRADRDDLLRCRLRLPLGRPIPRGTPGRPTAQGGVHTRAGGGRRRAGLGLGVRQRRLPVEHVGRHRIDRSVRGGSSDRSDGGVPPAGGGRAAGGDEDRGPGRYP